MVITSKLPKIEKKKNKVSYQKCILLRVLGRKFLSGMWYWVDNRHPAAANSMQGTLKQCCLYFKYS